MSLREHRNPYLRKRKSRKRRVFHHIQHLRMLATCGKYRSSRKAELLAELSYITNRGEVR